MTVRHSPSAAADLWLRILENVKVLWRSPQPYGSPVLYCPPIGYHHAGYKSMKSYIDIAEKAKTATFM